MSRFKKAVRQQARLRLGLDGPPGSGKSYTALRLAFSIPNIRVAFIEAGENSSALLYEGLSPDGIPWKFDHTEIKGNFSPMEYVAAIEDAGREGYDVIIVDSLSHAWAGTGGLLEQVGNAGFTDKDGWRKATPQHNRLIDAMLQSPAHVIATLRSKTEYVVEEVTDERGRKKSIPRKIGMAPIQRAGMEYEFTVYGSLDHSNTMTITKSRCSPVQGMIVHKPGPNFMRPVIEWLATGSVGEAVMLPKRVGEEQTARIIGLLKETGWKKDIVTRGLAQYQVNDVRHLTEEQATEFEATVAEWLRKRQEKERRAAEATTTEATTSESANGAPAPTTPTPATA